MIVSCLVNFFLAQRQRKKEIEEPKPEITKALLIKNAPKIVKTQKTQRAIGKNEVEVTKATLAGGTEGMLIGAALGSTFVPGVGTVLGGAAGYAVGAGAGYLTAHFPKSDIRKKSSVQFIGNEQEL